MTGRLEITAERDRVPSGGGGGPTAFCTTRWSVVLQAGRSEEERATEALEQLCRTYWYPLYAYVRRRGYAPADAQDLTQGFFASLLERRDLAGVAPEKGRFRTFLLSALGHYLANEWRRGQRQKRGAGQATGSFDALPAEEQYRAEPAAPEAPEAMYDQRWAWTVLEQAKDRLRDDYARGGRGDLFGALEPLLSGDTAGRSRAEMASELGIGLGALDVAVHRLRRRYGKCIRAIIAETVCDPEEVDAEIRHLRSVLCG